MKRARGQGLVEATIVLLVFFGLLLGVVDCGQVLIAHQALEERVRSAVRWGTLHPFDGNGEQVANLVLYDRIEGPRSGEGGFLGLNRANVQVNYRPSSVERPDDETIGVAIVNYESHFFGPWVGGKMISPRPVLVTAPMAYRPAHAP